MSVDELLDGVVRTTLLLCLAGRPDTDAEALRGALRTACADIGRRHVGGVEAQAASRLPERPLQDGSREATDGDAVLRIGSDYPPANYTAAVVLRAPAGSLDELVSTVQGLASLLTPHVDPFHSAAVAGTEETLLPGSGALLSLYVLRRRADLGPEAFHDYWRLEHTKIAMRIPGFRYRQVHAGRCASERAAHAAGVGVAGIDGVVEGYADDLAQFAARGRSGEAALLPQDERRFIDRPRCVLGYFRFLA